MIFITALVWLLSAQLTQTGRGGSDQLRDESELQRVFRNSSRRSSFFFFNEKKWWQEHSDTWHFVKLLQRRLRGNVLHQPFLKAGGKWRNLKQRQFQTEQLTKNSHRVKGEGLKDSRWTARAHTVCNTTCGTWIPAKGEDDGYIKISEVKLKGHFNLLHSL